MYAASRPPYIFIPVKRMKVMCIFWSVTLSDVKDIPFIMFSLGEPPFPYTFPSPQLLSQPQPIHNPPAGTQQNVSRN